MKQFKKNQKKKQAPKPPVVAAALKSADTKKEDERKQWSDWYESCIEYQPITVPNNARRRKTRDAYEKSKLRFLLRHKLPPIQELGSDQAINTENARVTNGNIFNSQTDALDIYAQLAISEGQSNTAFDENHNVIAKRNAAPDVTISDNVSSSKVDVIDIPEHLTDTNQNVIHNNGDVTNISDATRTGIGTSTIPNGSAINKNSQDNLITNDVRIVTKIQINPDNRVVPNKRKFNKACLAVVIVLIAIGILSSAIAMYFAFSAISEGR